MREIRIPERDYRHLGGSYGDQHVAAQYCGVSNPPRSIIGEWQHGWIGPERNIHPEFVIGSDGRSYERREKSSFLVARQDQVDYLNATGYTRVYAVGLPILYVARPGVERIPGSLLVMPSHSLPETKEDWNADAYAGYIASIAPRFATLCACVHQSCIDKGNWINAFRNLGARIIEGAEENDQNSLLRMAFLFSQFEFVTSNAFGSHIAYASYFGCKVSVSGPRPRWKRSDYENLAFYKNAPKVLDIVDEWNSSDFWGRTYPQFLLDPWQAKPQEDWAAWQLGLQCRRTPVELRKLLGWNFAGRILLSLRGFKTVLYRGYRIVQRAWYLIRSLGVPGLVAAFQLGAAEKAKGGISRVWCGWRRRLMLRNASSDIDVFEQHFARREILDISFPTKASTVVDLGANVGISVEVFRQLFPRARIIAVELDKQNAELCKENHATDRLVTVVNGAVWSEAGFVAVKDVGDGEWAYQVEPSPMREAAAIPALTYPQILAMHDVRSVDVMKMDIEGAEADVLEASWTDIFRTTAVCIIEIHDSIAGIEVRLRKVIEVARRQFDLDISRSGEFWVIRNRALLAA